MQSLSKIGKKQELIIGNKNALRLTCIQDVRFVHCAMAFNIHITRR